MKALKFYDKEGIGFELYADHEKQSVMMEIHSDLSEEPQQLEIDEDDIDDIIIAFVNLKNEVAAIRNASNN
jgi:catechol-2,3-dioxygenase